MSKSQYKPRKEMADTKTLDNVMVSAVRKQARENGYQFKNYEKSKNANLLPSGSLT